MKSFRLPSSAVRPRSSVLCPLSSVLRLLFSAFLISTPASFAQDDLFITVSAPIAGTAAQGSEAFTTVSLPAAQPVPAVVPAAVQPAPAEKPAALPVAAAATASPESESGEQWEQDLLRDPFWPVGFFPENWQKKPSVQSGAELDGSGWNAASGKLKISGTSRLGGRTAAIVNGELKSAGDLVQVLSEGKTYQWQIVGIDEEGRVQLKKQGMK